LLVFAPLFAGAAVSARTAIVAGAALAPLLAPLLPCSSLLARAPFGTRIAALHGAIMTLALARS